MNPKHAIIVVLSTAGCAGDFSPILGSDSEGMDSESSSSEGSDSVETSGESGTASEDGSSTSGSSSDESSDGSTGGEAEILGPGDPCDPLDEVAGISVCTLGYSCYLKAETEYACLPVVDVGDDGTEIGDQCVWGGEGTTSCTHSACIIDFNAMDDGQNPIVHTQAWIEFCGEGDVSCCTDWCDTADPDAYPCAEGWTCYPYGMQWPQMGITYGGCVPLAEG